MAGLPPLAVLLLAGCAEPEEPPLLVGSLSYSQQIDGEAVCEAAIAITGTATDTCVGCTFAFDVQAGLAATAPGCTFDPFLSLLADEDVGPLTLEWSYANAGYERLLRVGYGGTWETLAYTGSGDWSYHPVLYEGSGWGHFAADTLTWSVERHAVGEQHARDGTCGPVDLSYGSAPAGTDGVSGSLPCSGDAMDVWEIALGPGAPVNVLVDTLDAATTFDPVLWANDPDGCTVVSADDNVDCTAPPPDGQCPFVRLDAATTGTWQLVVAPYWSESCAGESARYELRTSGGRTPTLVQDDVLRWDITRTRVVGTATIR